MVIRAVRGRGSELTPLAPTLGGDTQYLSPWVKIGGVAPNTGFHPGHLLGAKMKNEPKSKPHTVTLGAWDLIREIKDHKARDFYGLIFLCSFQRDHDEDPHPHYKHRSLARRMGLKRPCCARRMLDVLQMKGSITREMKGRLEVTTIAMIADKDTKESVLVLRVGDKQFERWKQAGRAMRTALMLGVHTNPKGMILNGKQALATFIHEKVGVSVTTAHAHIKKLQDAKILYGYNERGLIGNKKQWWIDDFIMHYIDRDKRLSIE